jgi:hypothetical protein
MADVAQPTLDPLSRWWQARDSQCAMSKWANELCARAPSGGDLVRALLRNSEDRGCHGLADQIVGHDSRLASSSNQPVPNSTTLSR